MNKKLKLIINSNGGFTLTELITVMVMTSLIALNIGAYFVNEYKIRMSIINRANKTQEARIALRNLTEKLRFAKPSTAELYNNNKKIKAYIKSTHISHPQLTSGSTIYFQLDETERELQESYDDSNWSTIARDVSHFYADIEGADNDFLKLEIGIEADEKELQIQTGMKMLGEIQE